MKSITIKPPISLSLSCLATSLLASRLMAKELRIYGYSSDNRNSLIRRIKKKSHKKIKLKSLNN